MISRLLLVALLPLGGCITARVNAGPIVDFAGHVGVEAGVSIGLGSYGGGRKPVMFVERAGGGVSPIDHKAQLTIDAGVDLILEPDDRNENHTAFRVGPRLGARLVKGENGPDIALGFAVAWLPRVRAAHSSPDYDSKTEIFPVTMYDWTNLGFELGVYALPRETGAEAGYAQLSVTWEWITLNKFE
jgi:hypothetical protein